MFCSLAFEYLDFHAVDRRLGAFVSPVEKELAQSVCSCFMVNDWSTWCNRIGWTAKQQEPLGAAAVNDGRLTQIESEPSGGV
jgi:hypothetical protein